MPARGRRRSTSRHPPSQPAPPKERAPFWEIADIAFLRDQRNVDPVLLRASTYMLAVKEGEKLHRELLGVVRKKVNITIEAFGNRPDMFRRRNSLRGENRSTDADQPVNGFTDPFRTPDLFFDLDEKTGKPKGYNVLLVIPPARSPLDVRDEEQDVEQSEPFRRVRMSETLFHELLHVLRMATVVDYETQTIRPGPTDKIPEDFDPERAKTGHGPDAKFPISTKTLKLEPEGDVDGEFKARLISFVDQVVKKFDVKASIDKERAAFKAQSKSPR
jgi:hypothetical protein